MKRNLRIQAVLALIFLISILSCACVSVVETTENEGPAPRIEDLGEGELIASYAGEHIPARVAKDGDRWFMICQLYLSKDYSFSASDQPDGIDVKYEGEGTVWNLSASEGSAVWCERGKDLSRILLYDGAADEVREIARLATDAEKVQLAKTYIRSGHVYYSEIDYDRDKFLIHDYELASGETKVLREEDFDREAFGGCFAMRDDLLLYQCKSESDQSELTLLNVETGAVERVPLPPGYSLVYDADYDGKNLAVYYYDDSEGEQKWNQNDNIDVFRKGSERKMPIFSFPKYNQVADYAYYDDIELQGNTVLWIYQQNVSGDIADHYWMTVYNYLGQIPKEKKGTYHFMTDGEDLYWLSFHGRETKEVDLYRLIRE